MRLNFGRVSSGSGRPLTDLGTRSSPRGGSWAGPGAERSVTTTLGVSDRLSLEGAGPGAERPAATTLGVSDRPGPGRGANLAGLRTGGNRSGAAGVGTSLGVSSRPKGGGAPADPSPGGGVGKPEIKSDSP
jgi:hypothetical protein